MGMREGETGMEGVRGSRAGDVGHCFRWSVGTSKGNQREIGRRMRRLGGLTWFDVAHG